MNKNLYTSIVLILIVGITHCVTENDMKFVVTNKDTDPNSLYLDIDLVYDLENTNSGGKLADAFSFLVGVTVLHEYVHFRDNSDGVDYPGEEGSLFEKDAYGQIVWRSNASIILKEREK